MSKAFISYSHADEKILDRLHVHMAQLKREDKITTWFDKQIPAGSDLDDKISDSLSDSQYFLAIVSADYLNSEYCYNKEFQEALKLYQKGKIVIIPIIAEPCDWKTSPLGKIKAIPKDGKPISEWTNKETALLNVIDEIRRLVETKNSTMEDNKIYTFNEQVLAKNYKLKRDFTQVDIIEFRDQSFEIIKNYFKNSLVEISGVDQIQTKLINEEKKSFTCLISNRAKINSNGYISIYIPEHENFGRSDLSYSLTERPSSNTIQLDKMFQIEQSDYELFWSLRDIFNSQTKNTLSAKDIAEKLWVEFVKQVGLTFE